jgi:hypothetical protein
MTALLRLFCQEVLCISLILLAGYMPRLPSLVLCDNLKLEGCLLRNFLKFLGALNFSCEKRVVASRLSACPHGTFRHQPGGFSYVENLYQKLSTHAVFV